MTDWIKRRRKYHWDYGNNLRYRWFEWCCSWGIADPIWEEDGWSGYGAKRREER